MVTPGQRRAVVTHAEQTAALSEHRACRYLGVHRSLVRYQSCRPPEAALRVRLRQLAEQHPRWGSPRLTWLLRREGCVVNHKKVERLYREEDLTVRRRRGSGYRGRAFRCRLRWRPTSSGRWISCGIRWSAAACFGC